MLLDESFLRTLGILVVAGGLTALAARALRLPTILAYLIAGLIVGPATHLIPSADRLEVISEAGIVLLLFLVGLEMRIDKIRDIGKTAVVTGIFQVTATAALGFGVALAIDLPLREAALCAAAISFSSTVVVIKLLEEKGELNKRHGRIALGVLLVQDVLVIVLLTVLSAFGGGGSGDMEPGALAIALGKALGGMAVVLAVAAAASRWLLPRPFRWASRVPETLYIWALCWCFSVVLLAHVFHLSPEIGGFLAGVAVAQLPYAHDLSRRVRPLIQFFLAVFFVALGVRMELGDARAQWFQILALSTFVILGKMILIAWVVGRQGFDSRTAMLSGLSLAQISEFSLIVGAIGVQAGLAGESLISLLGAVSLVTFAATAVLIPWNAQIEGWLFRAGLTRWFGRPGRRLPDRGDGPPDLHGHVIVIGMNSLGRRIVRDLCAKDIPTVAIDTDPHKLAPLPCRTLHGHVGHEGVLDEAGLGQARLLVSALQIEETNDWLAFECRRAGIPCAVHVVDLSVIDTLLEMDVAYLMIPKVDGIRHQTEVVRKLGLLGAASSSPPPAK